MYYHTNGRPRRKEMWANGKRNGLTERWDEEGKLHDYQGSFVNDLSNGLWKLYWHGILRSDREMRNGKREGLERIVTEDGEIRWQVIYENDQPVKHLDKNDKVIKIIKYIDQGNGTILIKEEYPD